MLEMSQPLGCTTVWMQHVFVMSLVSKQTWNDFSDVCLICSVVILSFTLFHKWRLVPSGFFSHPIFDSRPLHTLSFDADARDRQLHSYGYGWGRLSSATTQWWHCKSCATIRGKLLQHVRPCCNSLEGLASSTPCSNSGADWLIRWFWWRPSSFLSSQCRPVLSSLCQGRTFHCPLLWTTGSSNGHRSYPWLSKALLNIQDWFHEKYDENLHKEMAALLDDAMLLFQSIYQILQLRPDATAAAHAAPDTGGPDTAPTVVIAPFALPDTVTPADPWTSTWRSTSDRVRTGDMPVEAAGYVFFANCHFGHVTDAGRLMFSNGNEMWKMWRKIVTMDVKPTEAVKAHRRSYVDLCHIGPFPFRWWCCLWPNMCWPTLHYPSC